MSYLLLWFVWTKSGWAQNMLGKGIRLQANEVAAVLLNFFKFKLVDERKEATYRTMFTLHMDHGLQSLCFSATVKSLLMALWLERPIIVILFSN